MKAGDLRGFCKKLLDPGNIYDVEYWVYVLTGCWDFKSRTRWKNVLYKLYQLVVVVIYAFSLTFFMVDASSVSNDLEKLSLNMSSSFLLFVTMGKVCLFFKKRDGLEEVYDKLEHHLYVKTIGDSEKDKQIFRRKAEILFSITLTFYSFLMVGLPLRVVADTTLTRTYLIPMPYREKMESHFELIYMPQVLVIFHFLVTVLAHDLLVFAVLIRFIAHFEILEKNFLKIKALYPRTNPEARGRGVAEKKPVNDVLIRSKSNSDEVQKFPESYILGMVNRAESRETRERKTYEMLKENITHHQVLLRETENFCCLYSSPLLVQACGVSILIGIIMLQVFFLSDEMNVLLVEQLIYMTTLLCNVFYLCTFATELRTKSAAVAEALYDTPWYEMDLKNRRIIQIAIKKMLEGPKLKGGGQIVVNRETYLKFLRISYNLIAVLRQVY